VLYRPLRRRSTSVEKPELASASPVRDSSEATPPSGIQITPPVFEIHAPTTPTAVSPGQCLQCCLTLSCQNGLLLFVTMS